MCIKFLPPGQSILFLSNIEFLLISISNFSVLYFSLKLPTFSTISLYFSIGNLIVLSFFALPSGIKNAKLTLETP